MKPSNTDKNQLPLSGKRIMITRPIDQSKTLSEKIIALAGEPVVLPTIATEPFEDMSGWSNFEKNFDKISWIIFTSENGVRYFISQLNERKIDIEKFKGIKIAGIGRGTSAALSSHSLKPDFVPTKAVVDSLVEEMPSEHNLSGTVVLRIRGNLADKIIEETFPAHGANVIPLTVYRTFHPLWSDDDRKQFWDNLPDAVLFTSGSTVLGLMANLDSDQFKRLLIKARVFSIGPKVSAVLKEKGITFEAEASEHNIEGLIDVVKNYYISN